MTVLSAPPSKAAERQKSTGDPLAGRIIGTSLALYGLVAIWLAAGRLLSSPSDDYIPIFESIQRSLSWLDILFGVGLLLVGAGIALRRAWTRGTGWMACIIVALLIPSGFDALYALLRAVGLGESIPWLMIPLTQAALFVVAAALLYRNPPPIQPS